MKCLFLTKSRDNPATRYRADPVVRRLLDRGDSVEVIHEAGALRQVWLVFRLHRYDIVFVQRKLFGRLFLFLLVRLARRLVFDFDDAVHLRSSGEPSATRKARFAAMVAGSDLVLAGNRYLAQAAEGLGARATVIPTSVALEKYATVDAASDPGQPFTLVWIGSRSTSRYLEQHRSVFDAIGQAHPGIRFKVIGDFTISFEALETICVPWSEESEARELASAHVGVAPMTDDPWTRGKCALKVIQYMAAGLPVISSAAGANREVVVQGETGLLANTEDEWVLATGRLRQSVTLRDRLGRAGRDRAEAYYATPAVAGQVITLLDQVRGVS